MTELILYYDGSVYPLDLTGVTAFPISGSVADVRDPSKKDTSYSKTISIPGTAQNNRALKFIFEISGVDGFNPNKKVRCVVKQDGIQIPQVTFFRLQQINRTKNGSNNYSAISYDCNVFGALADLMKSWGDALLEDLDFSEYDHTYNRDNIEASWTDYNDSTLAGNILFVNDNAGFMEIQVDQAHGLLAGDIVYIAYNGQNYKYNGNFFVKEIVSADTFVIYHVLGIVEGADGVVKKFEPTGLGFYYPMIDFGQNFGDQWKVTEFMPALRPYEYLKKMFAAKGWRWDSEFLESDYFKIQAVPFNDVIVTQSAAEIAAKLFRASLSGDINPPDLSLGNGPIYNNAITPYTIPFNNDSTAPNFDNAGTYNTGTFTYTSPNGGRTAFSGIINYNVFLDDDPFASYPIRTGIVSVQVNVYVNGNPTINYGPFQTNMQSQSHNDYIQFTTNDIELLTGDVVTFKVTMAFTLVKFIDVLFNQFTGALNATLTLNQNSYVQAVVTDASVIEGSTMVMANAIPKNIKQADFFMWICKNNNLYIDDSPDQSKTLRIETRDRYYAGNTTIDITHLLDLQNHDVKVLPMGELNTKRYTFGYKPDTDLFNADHLRVYGTTYGTKKIDVDNDFMQGEIKVETGFSPTPLADYPVGTDRIISTIQGDGLITQNRIGSNIRILFTMVRGTDYAWDFIDNAGATPYNIYPYAGHLDNVWCPLYDLNFGFPGGVYYNYTAWTDNNLYNIKYKKAIEEIIDPDAKVVQAFFKLTPLFFNTLDFRNYLRVDNHVFRLNKYVDFDPVQGNSTMMELIKVKNIALFVPTTKPSITVADKDTFNEFVPNPPTNGGRPMLNLSPANNSNYKRGNNSGVIIQGRNNTIGFGVKNCIVIGDNNVLNDGVQNVMLIGVDGVTVAQSNYTIIAAQKKQLGILNQSSTNAPTDLVSESNITGIVWTRFTIGKYRATLAGAFPADKTFLWIGSPNNSPGGAIDIYRLDDDTIEVLTGYADGSAQYDDALFNTPYWIYVNQ